MSLHHITLYLILLLTGASALAQENAGFLSDYSRLAPVAGRPNLQTFVDRSASYGNFTRVSFTPPAIILAAGDKTEPDVSAVTRQRMMARFDAAFRAALGSDYDIVDLPGPDVLRVRLAITGIQPTRSDLQTKDFLPLRLVFQVARAAAGLAPTVVEMAGEMEVLAPDGTVLLAATATRKGEAELAQADQVTWQEMEPILSAWALGFRRLLDELRSPPGSVKN